LTVGERVGLAVSERKLADRAPPSPSRGARRGSSRFVRQGAERWVLAVSERKLADRAPPSPSRGARHGSSRFVRQGAERWVLAVSERKLADPGTTLALPGCEARIVEG